jgi:tetratricopeptide (TPR) repeat protein
MNTFRLAAILVLSIVSASAFGDECGSLANRYGPFDYRSPTNREEYLPRVESSHFSDVTYSLALQGASNIDYMRHFEFGATATNTKKNTALPSDIDYTLRAFPNHPKALYAMSEYQRRTGPPKPGANYRTAKCYFIRAIRFAPDDPTVHMLYGIYFHKRDKYKQALQQYKIAEKLDPEYAELMFNMGLLYFDMDDLEKAKHYSDKAIKLGYPLKGLQRKIDQKLSERKGASSDAKK